MIFELFVYYEYFRHSRTRLGDDQRMGNVTRIVFFHSFFSCFFFFFTIALNIFISPTVVRYNIVRTPRRREVREPFIRQTDYITHFSVFPASIDFSSFHVLGHKPGGASGFFGGRRQWRRITCVCVCVRARFCQFLCTWPIIYARRRREKKRKKTFSFLFCLPIIIRFFKEKKKNRVQTIPSDILAPVRSKPEGRRDEAGNVISEIEIVPRTQFVPKLRNN